MNLANKRSYFVSGVVICLIGAICFSTKAIFVKLAYRDTDIEAVPLLALRMIFSLPFFVVSAFYASRKVDNKKFTGKQWIYVALIGFLGYYLSSLLDFLGLQYVSAAIERLILFIYPTLVLLISSFVFKDHITLKQWLAVGITYIGLMIAFLGEASLTENQTENFYIGSAFIFACAVTYAMYIVGSGRLIPVIGAAKFNSYAMTFSCIGVLLHFLVTSNQPLWDFHWLVYVYSILMAVISTVIPSYFVTEGIKRIGADNAAIVASVGPVSTIVQANIFLDEPVSFLQIAGTALVLAGVLLIGRSKQG